MRVARYGAGRTNQKFYFCKIALEQCESATDDAHKQAHYEAAVFHLHGAFLAFLQELSRFYKLSPQLATSQAIRVALELKGQVSPEISQLQALETIDLWLGQLQKTFTEYQLAADPVEPQPEAELPDSLIVRMVTMNEEPVVDIARVQTWYKQLQGLITEFRQEMVEF